MPAPIAGMHRDRKNQIGGWLGRRCNERCDEDSVQTRESRNRMRRYRRGRHLNAVHTTDYQNRKLGNIADSGEKGLHKGPPRPNNPAASDNAIQMEALLVYSDALDAASPS